MTESAKPYIPSRAADVYARAKEALQRVTEPVLPELPLESSAPNSALEFTSLNEVSKIFAPGSYFTRKNVTPIPREMHLLPEVNSPPPPVKTITKKQIAALYHPVPKKKPPQILVPKDHLAEKLPAAKVKPRRSRPVVKPFRDTVTDLRKMFALDETPAIGSYDIEWETIAQRVHEAALRTGQMRSQAVRNFNIAKQEKTPTPRAYKTVDDIYKRDDTGKLAKAPRVAAKQAFLTAPAVGPGTYFSETWKPDTMFLKRLQAMQIKRAKTAMSNARQLTQKQDPMPPRSATRMSISMAPDDEAADPGGHGGDAVRQMMRRFQRAPLRELSFGSLQLTTAMLKPFETIIPQAQQALIVVSDIDLSRHSLQPGAAFQKYISLLFNACPNLRVLLVGSQHSEQPIKKRLLFGSLLLYDLMHVLKGNTSLSTLVLPDLPAGGGIGIGNCIAQFAANCPSLTHMDVSNNQLDEAAITTLVGRLKDDDCAGLQSLNLSENQFSSKAVMRLADTLITNDSLHTLALRNCGLTDQAIDIVIGEIAAVNTTLTQLDLSYNDLTDKTAILISEVMSLHPFQLLNLTHTNITIAGTHALAAAAQNSTSLCVLGLPPNARLPGDEQKLLDSILASNLAEKRIRSRLTSVDNATVHPSVRQLLGIGSRRISSMVGRASYGQVLNMLPVPGPALPSAGLLTSQQRLATGELVPHYIAVSQAHLGTDALPIVHRSPTGALSVISRLQADDADTRSRRASTTSLEKRRSMSADDGGPRRSSIAVPSYNV